MKIKIKFKYLGSIILLLSSAISLYSQDFNKFELESLNHWNLKISSIRWESATVRNALEIPYITFLSDLLKNKYNLVVNDIPNQIHGVGYQLSTPKCSKEKCSDLYVQLIVSKSNHFIATREFSEKAEASFNLGSDIQTISNINNSQTIFSSKKQDLKNINLGYLNDYYLLQSNPYTKNIGIRFGFILDAYQYIANIIGTEFFDAILISKFTNNTSLNSINSIFSTIYNQQELSYLEFALKIKLGINYAYEFLEKNLVFLGLDYHYGYGAVHYELKENIINLDLFNLLQNSSLNPLALLNAYPKSKLTDGPAFLEIPGYEAFISYGYKIQSNQILRIVYKKKEEYHNLKLPRIEPDEKVNLTAIQTGDLTPLILSEIKPIGLLPNSKDVIREIGIEYMIKF